MFSRDYLKDLTERGLKTAVQFGVLGYGLDATEVTSMNLRELVLAAASGFILSAVTSLVSKYRGNKDSASALKE